MWWGKCPVGEMSVRGNVQSGKCSSGKCPVGELPVRGNVRRGGVRRGTVQSGNYPHTVQKAFQIFLNSEAALQMCYYEKLFWKNAEHLQENIHAEVRFQ